VVDNGGPGPNGQVVGAQDQRSKIRTFNIAPTWTHLINAHTIFTFGAYVRQDQYNVGTAYNFKPTNTVIRVSHARTMETPFNENLVLASLGCNDAVINALPSTVPNGACTTAPLSPGHRNEFHAGRSQAVGRFLVIDGECIWKSTHKAFDFSVLGATRHWPTSASSAMPQRVQARALW
jgi:hypothetical protein